MAGRTSATKPLLSCSTVAKPIDMVMMLLIVCSVAGCKLFGNTHVNPWASGKTPKQNRDGHDALDHWSGGGGGGEAI